MGLYRLGERELTGNLAFKQPSNPSQPRRPYQSYYEIKLTVALLPIFSDSVQRRSVAAQWKHWVPVGQ